jgi:hypothetical protein
MLREPRRVERGSEGEENLPLIPSSGFAQDRPYERETKYPGNGYNEDIMMRRSSDIKKDIEKIKKLQALEQKATDKLNRITERAAAKPLKKKKTRPAVKSKPVVKNKAKTTVKKSALWQKLTGEKSAVKKREKPSRAGNKKQGKKGPDSPSGGNEGFFFRHFGR